MLAGTHAGRLWFWHACSSCVCCTGSGDAWVVWLLARYGTALVGSRPGQGLLRGKKVTWQVHDGLAPGI